MNKTLGQKIKTSRKNRELTLGKLSEISNISKSYIWELESGRANPTIDKLSKLSNILGVTIDYLINDEELSDEVYEKAFFRKFKLLNEDSQRKIEKIIDIFLSDGRHPT
jgi:transcriptional regulator with XRE-family HTH domain